MQVSTAVRRALEAAPAPSRVPTLEQIRAIEQGIKEGSIPGLVALDEIPPIHRFADGIYSRELRRPAGTLIVGKMHRKRHFYVVLEGEIVVWTEQGKTHHKAGAVITTEPGTKRITYAVTDASTITFHGTSETDLEKIEAELIISDLTEQDAAARALLELENVMIAGEMR